MINKKGILLDLIWNLQRSIWKKDEVRWEVEDEAAWKRAHTTIAHWMSSVALNIMKVN